MTNSSAKQKFECSAQLVASYLDCEMTPEAELSIEAHFAACAFCREELNFQKQTLLAIDSLFVEQKEMDPPANFARVVAANAENQVVGLRSKKEGMRVLLISAALFLACVVSATDAGRTFQTLSNLFKNLLLIIQFLFGVFYQIAFGGSVLIRSFSKQTLFHSSFAVILLIGLFVSAAFLLSKLLSETKRV